MTRRAMDAVLEQLHRHVQTPEGRAALVRRICTPLTEEEYRRGMERGILTDPVLYRKTDRAESREERMADYLAAYLLMPDSVLIAMMKSRDYRPLVSYEDVMPRADERFFTNMTRSLQVSSSALARRLRDAGFWEDRSIYEYEDPERPWGFDPIGGVMP